MTNNKYAKRNIPAGVLALIYGVLMVIFSVAQFSSNPAYYILNFLLGLLTAFWAVTLLIGRRNALPSLAALVLAVFRLIYGIEWLALNPDPSALAVLNALLLIAAFLLLAAVTFVGLQSRTESLRRLVKTLWVLPAGLMALDVVSVMLRRLALYSEVFEEISFGILLWNLLTVILPRVLLLLAMLFACQWAALGGETQEPGYPAAPFGAPPVGQGQDTAEILRRFKGLLDDGIITQEEFEAKKKQLLG